jgi:hypothetical protein
VYSDLAVPEKRNNFLLNAMLHMGKTSENVLFRLFAKPSVLPIPNGRFSLEL